MDGVLSGKSRPARLNVLVLMLSGPGLGAARSESLFCPSRQRELIEADYAKPEPNIEPANRYPSPRPHPPRAVRVCSRASVECPLERSEHNGDLQPSRTRGDSGG